MRRLAVLIFLSILTVACGSKAPPFSGPAAIAVSTASKLNNSISINLSQFGLEVSGDRSVIANPTPFCARTVVFNRELPPLKPGNAFYDTTYLYTIGMIAPPIITQYYRACLEDPADPERTLYAGHVGYAAGICALGPNVPCLWAPRPGDITTPQGSRMSWDHDAYPQPDTTVLARKVTFPRWWWSGTTVRQFYNPTDFTQVIIGAGKRGRNLELPPHALAFDFTLAKDRERVVFVELLDRGRLSSFAAVPVRLYAAPSEGVATQQIILHHWDFR